MTYTKKEICNSRFFCFMTYIWEKVHATYSKKTTPPQKSACDLRQKTKTPTLRYGPSTWGDGLPRIDVALKLG